MMFAGHHTTSGTAAWTLIELLRHPEFGRRVVDELDALYADGREVSHQALREIPELENGIKEALRLHPPLILLMRKVVYDFHYKGFTVPAGKLVGVSPALSNRLPECFPDPDRYDPDRYARGPRGGRAAVRLDSVRRGPPPLRGRGLRDDAAEGDLQHAPARYDVRAGAAARELPQRPLEDGRAARQAVPRRGTGVARGEARRREDPRRHGSVSGPRRVRAEAPERLRARPRRAALVRAASSTRTSRCARPCARP